MLTKKKSLYAIFLSVAVFLNSQPGRAQYSDWSNSYEDDYDLWDDYADGQNTAIGIYIDVSPEVAVYQHNPIIAMDWPIVYISFAPIWYRSTFYYCPYYTWYEPFRPLYHRRIHVVWHDPFDFYYWHGGFVYANTVWGYPDHRFYRWQRHFDWSPRYRYTHFGYHRQSPYVSHVWTTPAKNRPAEYARRRTDTRRLPVTQRLSDNRSRRDGNRRVRDELNDRPGNTSENRSSAIEKRTRPQIRDQQPPAKKDNTRLGDQQKRRQEKRPNTEIKQREKKKLNSDKRYTANGTDSGKNRVLDRTKSRNIVRDRNKAGRSNTSGASRSSAKTGPAKKSIRKNENPVKKSPKSNGIRDNRQNQRAQESNAVRTRSNKSRSIKSTPRTAKSGSSQKEKARGGSSRQSNRSGSRR